MANHVTALRKNAGYKTVKEAAEKLEISNGMLFQVEEDLKKPSPKLGIKMSKLFNCTLDDIFLPYDTTNGCKRSEETNG